MLACNTLQRLVRRLPAWCRGRIIPGDTALHPFDRLAVTVFCNRTPGNFPLAGEFVNRQTDLFDRKLGRSRNLAVEQLAVFLKVLEDYIGSHVEPFQEIENYTFFTNSDFNCMAPMPSILQSMS